MILSSEEIKQIQAFKDAAFKSVMDQIKSGTSWKDKENLRDKFEQSGFTGDFAFLQKYYEGNEGDMLDAIYNLWDSID